MKRILCLILCVSIFIVYSASAADQLLVIPEGTTLTLKKASMDWGDALKLFVPLVGSFLLALLLFWAQRAWTLRRE